MARNHGELEEARKDSSVKPQREQVPADTLTLGFWSPELWENKFLLFEATHFFFLPQPQEIQTPFLQEQWQQMRCILSCLYLHRWPTVFPL